MKSNYRDRSKDLDRSNDRFKDRDIDTHRNERNYEKGCKRKIFEKHLFHSLTILPVLSTVSPFN